MDGGVRAPGRLPAAGRAAAVLGFPGGLGGAVTRYAHMDGDAPPQTRRREVPLLLSSQGTAGPDPTTVYVDMRALRHDR